MQQNIALQKQAVALHNKALRPFIVTQNAKEYLAQIPERIRNVFCPAASYIRKAMQIVQANSYETSQTVGTIASLDVPAPREINPKSCYTPAKLPFGAYEYTVPADYDTVLRNMYGDYMQLPPEEDRKIPQIGCYWVE